ncbi:MAG: type VI secretion system tip protein TssI/VgrG [Sulfuricurvum sp.]|nr:type VI secretion system tip protein TssI/VgrG [Sulfuricurvum sp.]
MEVASSLLNTLMGASRLINRRVSCRLKLKEYKASNRILSVDSYSVYSLEGKSEVARSYEYTVVFVSDEAIGVEAIADTVCEITLRDEISPLSSKKVAGRISHAKEAGSVGRKHLYEITVVSPLYYLSLNRRSEIYMDKSVPEIIGEIIKRYDALLNLNLIVKTDSVRYPKRHYTTQYFQSDYAFITMLCEEEGLVLLIDESSSESFNLTLCELTSHAPIHNTPIEAIYNLEKAFNVSTQNHDYYDPSKPSLDMSHTTKSSTGFLKDNSTSTQLRNSLTRHSLKDRLDKMEGSLAKDLNRYGSINAERSYTPNESISGESTSLSLKEGIHVKLNDTKVFKQTDAIILSVEYNGFFPNALDELIESEHEQQEQYTATFKAIPAEVTYRPPYTIAKPRIDGVHTARVSKGDQELTKGANEIDVNEKGEIRVIMHFDPKYPTTCYIPLNTLYAGDGYGMRFLPRVNSEVLISYINGNIDRPIIIGMLHNGENTIPYDLPSTKTQSYIKTQTTPQYTDTEGYNEILFEDAQNNEQFNMRAQKDYSLLVLNDATEHIQHDRSETVDNNEDVTIHGYRQERVNKSKTETIDIAKALTIGAGYQVSVGASKNESVGISSTEQVGAMKYTIVGQRYELQVGASSIILNNDGTIMVQGNKVSIIGNEHVEIKSKLVDIN